MEVPKFIVNQAHFIRGDHKNSHFFGYYLEYLIFHLPPKMIAPAFNWLIKSGLREQNFVDFIRHECHSSGLEFLRYITMRLERETRLRALNHKDIQ